MIQKFFSQVTYFSHNTEVAVDALEDVVHVHEENSDDDRTLKVFKWSSAMTKIVEEMVEKHKPKEIRRKLKNSNVCPKRLPTSLELYNKIRDVKRAICPASKISTTQELRMKVAEYLVETDSENEAFVPFYVINDDDETKEPRFTIIFSTKKNLAKLKSERVLQTDATYRLNWYGFPVFVIGK